MLESKKLRPVMDLLAVELPAAGSAASFRGEPPQLRDLRLGIGLRRELFQIVPDELVQARSLGLGHLPGLLHEAIFDRESPVHCCLLLHIIRAHGCTGNQSSLSMLHWLP